MPQKMIKPPDASQTYLVEPRGSGKANLLDVLQSHMCAAMPAFPRRLRSPRRIPLGTPPSMVLLPDLRPQTQRREEPTEGTPRKRSRSRSRKPPLPSSPVRLTQTRRQTLVREVGIQNCRVQHIGRTDFHSPPLPDPNRFLAYLFNLRTSRSPEKDGGPRR